MDMDIAKGMGTGLMHKKDKKISMTNYLYANSQIFKL